MSFTRKRERANTEAKSTIQLGVLREKHKITGQIFQTIPFSYVSIPLKLKEVTWDSTHVGPPYSEGGDFCNIKVTLDANTVKGTGIYREPNSHSGPVSQKIWEYSGGFCRPIHTWEADLIPSYTNIGSSIDPTESGFVSSLTALGDEAFDRLRPRLEVAGASVFLGEARDLPRMLRTSAGFFHQRWKAFGGNDNTPMMAGAKDAADHFINHNFAWVPFINDLKKFDKVFQSSYQYLLRIKQANGLWVRKERLLDQTEQFTTIRSGNNGGIPWRQEFNSMCNEFPGSGGVFYRYVQSQRNSTRTWATGSFLYYRPEFDSTDIDKFMSVWNTVYRLLTVYGARVNPSVIWKLTPWSWLIDWFTNIGQIIDRAVAWSQDSVVSRWMFIMKETKTLFDHVVTINWKDGSRTMSWTHDLGTKQRQKASSSFSFSLVDPLSGRQLAILAALGIGRAKVGRP